MIHFASTKGLVMTILVIIVLIALTYFICCKTNASHIEFKEENVIPQRIKDEINDHFGQLLCLHVSLDAIGLVYEDFNSEDAQIDRPTYLVQAKVKLKRNEKCITVLIDDLSEINIRLAIQELVKKIINAKDDLLITC